MMNFRLARPAVLIDINKIRDLDYITAHSDVLEIGALARHVSFEEPMVPGPLGALLAQMARFVGHMPIRIRGTFVGSVAHADPASEWCVLVRTLDGVMVAQGPGGRRELSAESFFQTVFTTALRDDELLVAVRLPLLSDNHRVGFSEFARRSGDFALVMCVAVVGVDGGVVAEARIGLGGVSDVPLRATDAETAIVGMAPGAEAAARAGDIAAGGVEPFADIHGSSEYRRDLVRTMVTRALRQAFDE